MFFVLLEDIRPILKEFESSFEIRYYKMRLLDNRNIPTYDSFLEIPNVGIATSGDGNRVDNYLIMPKSTSLNVRNIPQRTGDMKFAVDQLENAKSMELKLGGKYQNKENVIVAGRIATVSEDESSSDWFTFLSMRIKKNSLKVDSFYVGKQTEDKLRHGWRLVTNEKLSEAQDLKLKV